MGVNMSIPAAFEDALTTNEQLEWLYKNKEALLQAGANIEISRQGDRTIITAKGEGFSPVVEVEEIPGGHSVTITDGEGPHTFYVMDGIDGTTPTVEVSSITGGYRLTITNGTVHESVNIMNGVDGSDGADGDSIVVKSVESVEGGVNLTVTDKNGDHVIFLMNGPQGLTGPQGIQGIQGEKGDTGATPIITANASVNNVTGVPSVTVTKTGTDEYPNFSFAFQNMKGEKGDKGDTGSGGTAATITVGSTTTGQPGTSASVTNSGTSAAAVLDFVIPEGQPGQNGQDGQDGTDGITPIISATASVDSNVGTPGVTVTKTGTDAAPSFAFDFVNLKGDTGATGADGGEMIAEEYDPTSSTAIAVGDYRRYEGDLYKCIAAIPASAGDWDITGFSKGQIPDYDVTKNYPPISSSAVVYEGNVYIPTQYAVAGVTPEDTTVWAQQTVEHYDGSVPFYSTDTIFEVDGTFYVSYVPTNLTMVPLYPAGYNYLTLIDTLSSSGNYGPTGATSYMEYNGNLYQNNTGGVISLPASFDSEQWDDVSSQATEFSSSGYYSVGDLISYDGYYFYVTNKYVGRGSIGDFDPTDWTETLVGNEFKGIRQVPSTGDNDSVLTKQGSGYAFMGKAVPGINAGDAGKVLTVNGLETGIYWATPASGLPTIESGDAGKVLTVNNGETGAEWVTPSGGGGSGMKSWSYTYSSETVYNVILGIMGAIYAEEGAISNVSGFKYIGVTINGVNFIVTDITVVNPSPSGSAADIIALKNAVVKFEYIGHNSGNITFISYQKYRSEGKHYVGTLDTTGFTNAETADPTISGLVTVNWIV